MEVSASNGGWLWKAGNREYDLLNFQCISWSAVFSCLSALKDDRILSQCYPSVRGDSRLSLELHLPPTNCAECLDTPAHSI